MLIGFWLLVMGGRNPTAALLLLTTAIVGTLFLIGIYQFVWPYTPEWTVFIAIYLTFGLGGGLGVGATMQPRIGVIVCGASMGYLLGLCLDLAVI